MDGEDWYVEVKHVTSNTVNQVRAIKFIPLMIFSPQRPRPWAVLPPQEVIRLVYLKNRGQHTELALECANLTLNQIPERFWHESAGLRLAVLAAIQSAQRYQALRTCMQDLLLRIRALKQQVEAALKGALDLGDGPLPSS